MKRWILIFSIIINSQAFALSPTAKIISQTSAPVTITKYDAEYRERTNYSLGGIHHKVSYKNTGKQTIEAIQFGLVSFNIWNEFIGSLAGISMKSNDPGDTENGAWIDNAYGDFAFHSGFAYVKKIRYADGTIWKADLEEIRKELAKIQADFDVKSLEPKRDK